jgi:F-type H+/Na+-transporting ATPase subunit alpha
MANKDEIPDIKKMEEELAKRLQELINPSTAQAAKEEEGEIIDFADGVGHMTSVESAKIGLKLELKKSTERARAMESKNELDIFGLTVDIDEESIGLIAFGEEKFIKQGDKVKVTDQLLKIPVTKFMLGRVIDPFCRPLDKDLVDVPEELNWFKKGSEEIIKENILTLPIERKAPSVIDRSKIKVPFLTGINTIDSMLPIGRGQRMLVIGDRGTGKTSVGLDSIKNQNMINQRLNSKFNYDRDKIMDPEFYKSFDQHDPNTVYCIYVAIGRKASEVRQIAEKLKKENSMHFTVIVAAMANDPASLLYIAPFSGCTIGEYFRDRGKNAMIVYDDLSKHATAYRQISLLLRRPPGREAYPGDIFYLHSRLLERASTIKDYDINTKDIKKKISDEYKSILKPFNENEPAKGKGSLTAFPIIETKQNDVASYIPTNVISITDGQVYLLDELFNEGFKPAINIGISVSRVGSNAQTKAMKEVSEGLGSFLANYREKDKNLKFIPDKSDSDRQILDRGLRITHFLKQQEFRPFDLERQVCSIFVVRRGFYDVIPQTEKLESHCHKFEDFIWSKITDKDNIHRFRTLIDTLKTDGSKSLSPLKDNNGDFYIEKLSNSIDIWQIEFLEKRFQLRSELLDIFKKNVSGKLDFYKNNYILTVKKLLKTTFPMLGMNESLHSLFAKIMIKLNDIRQQFKDIRFGDRYRTFNYFSKEEQADKFIEFLNVINYDSEILSSFLFSYFIEEKQNLKRSFILHIENEYADDIDNIHEKMNDVINYGQNRFLSENGDNSEDSKKRIHAIKEKSKSIFISYLKNQKVEVNKLIKMTQNFKKEKPWEESPSLKITSNIDLLDDFKNQLSFFSDIIDKIIESMYKDKANENIINNISFEKLMDLGN